MVNKMDEYFEGKVKEVQSAEDASYFLENTHPFCLPFPNLKKI